LPTLDIIKRDSNSTSPSQTTRQTWLSRTCISCVRRKNPRCTQ